MELLLCYVVHICMMMRSSTESRKKSQLRVAEISPKRKISRVVMGAEKGDNKWANISDLLGKDEKERREKILPKFMSQIFFF